MSYNVGTFIVPECILEFIEKLIRSHLNWSNMSECAENYDNNKFSQKNSEGLEKFVTIINGNRIILSVLPKGDEHIYNLEISYADEPNSIYELPYMDNADIQKRLGFLLDSVYEQRLFNYRKMDHVLFDCCSL